MESNDEFSELFKDEQFSNIFDVFNLNKIQNNEVFQEIARLFEDKLKELEQKSKTCKLWITYFRMVSILKDNTAAERMVSDRKFGFDCRRVSAKNQVSAAVSVSTKTLAASETDFGSCRERSPNLVPRGNALPDAGGPVRGLSCAVRIQRSEPYDNYRTHTIILCLRTMYDSILLSYADCTIISIMMQNLRIYIFLLMRW
ncbi:hypothetical protein WA026_010241 [Henosepilachna vigintioctopunctata]|uniref:Uncharacterized protein n=1 Tax=Henosepilachna vigintioctopunctata TaxID=420089 RepID=A0AAW1UHN0_9CUCU